MVGGERRGRALALRRLGPMTPLGIDLGTSFCRAFVVKPSGAVVPVVGEDGAWIPSAVTCCANGELVAGSNSFLAAEQDGIVPFHGALRLLGRRFYSPEIDWLRHGLAGDVVPSPNGDAWLRIGAYELAPEQLVASVLSHVMEASVRALGSRPSTVAIAIPNTFDQLQRRALTMACELAGVPLRTFVQASSAFALSLPPQSGAKRVAVLDLGAGHFSVGLLEQDPKGWSVIAADGDGLLGGMDFDRRLVGLLPGGPEPSNVAELCTRAEQLRHILTDTDRAMWGTKDEAEAVTRADHDTAVAEELESLGVPCAQILLDVELGTDDVDDIILIGGLARVPSVRQNLAKLFRQMPVELESAADFTGLGALSAARGQRATAVSTRSIGVKVRGGLMSPIVPRGRRLPWEASMSFGAPRAGQSQIVFEVYEGEEGEAANNTYIGSFVLEGVEPGHPPRVTFALDDKGMFRVGQWSTGTRRGDSSFNWAGGYPKVRGLEVTVVADDYARVPQSSAALSGGDDPSTVVMRKPPPSRHDSSQVRPSTRPPPSSDDGQPLSSDDPLVATIVGGRYKIESVIAEGAMGRVYRATHSLLGRRFAVKVLHPELAQNEELAMRFLREAQSAARIESEHVVDIVDFGRLDDGTGYFVMEHLDGLTLGTLIKNRGRIDPELSRDIGVQIANGVAAAHAIDIVHRDLKPDNISLVERHGVEYFPKILDFGIAKHPTSASEGPITMAGSLVGSPYYMAPEQIIGGEITPETDIYSMGIMLFEMMTGAPPFLADSVAHVLQMHMDEPPPPMAERGADCPSSLEAVIRRCMEKKPPERYATAQDLIAALGEAL
jgi:molecular chaperone DnaK (HSP70)/tRNA A-37 threonylcarbamoyl transferase component Bud32